MYQFAAGFQHELKRELILQPSDMPEMLIPHAISLMTRPPGNSFGPLALLDVYAGGTDTVTKVSVVRFDIEFVLHGGHEHEALGLGLSYTCHGAFCTENEVYHFHKCLPQDWERRGATHVAVSTRPAGDGV